MYEYRAKVDNVVDGDTIDLEVDLGFTVFGDFRVRLLGINAPESRGKDKCEAGIHAKEVVTQELLDKYVIIKSVKDETSKDNFGRWLATVYLDGKNYNQSLLERGLAEEFMPVDQPSKLIEYVDGMTGEVIRKNHR